MVRFVIVLFVLHVFAAGAAPRAIISLDSDWRFHRGDIPNTILSRSTNAPFRIAADFLDSRYNDSSWQRINVPHDYIVEGAFDPKAETQHASLLVEPAWYRKTIAIPASDQGRRLWLEFDGVYRDSQMWLNGHFLGRHASGFTSFQYDVTGIAKAGTGNLLVVRVDPTEFEGWWYEGGGIYRHARLVSVAPNHVAPLGVHIIPNVKDPRDGIQADARVEVTTTVANDDASAVNTILLTEAIDASGAPVTAARTTHDIAAHTTFEFKQSFEISNAKLWSCEHPCLYRLRTSIFVATAPSGDRIGKGRREVQLPAVQKLVDQITTDFGVRTIRFDVDHGFFLNGKPVKIKGVCNHQDFAGVGMALPDRIHEFRIRKIKEMGANAVRFSHHMMASEYLDACDRLGVLVMAENRHLDDSPEILRELETLVRRDRNHPSVVIWSISNEEKEQGSDLGARQGRAMVDLIHKLDSTRSTTAAMNNCVGQGLTKVIDIQGFNYHPDTWDKLHRELGKMPCIATEIAAAVGTRGCYQLQPFIVTNDTAHYQGNPVLCQVAAYDVNAADWANTAEVAWKAVAERPWMAGGFAWSGFDYRGEPNPFGWPAINSQFGIMDTCGFPKDAFYYYQSWWGARPVLHLFPHWNWPGREGEEIPVWVYSNCERVELILNGISLGAQSMTPNSHLEWKVKYAPGKLVAKGTRNGQTLESAVETAGAPAAIALEPNRPTIDADGADVSLITVKIIDDQGRTVPFATNAVSFNVTGPGRLLGVGNGNPACHESDKANQRSAFNGLCLAIIQSTREPGAIRIQADSPGLKSAEVKIQTR